MKKVLSIVKIIVAILLFISMAYLPSGYYKFLRIAVFTASIIIIYLQFATPIPYWLVAFGIIAVLFNPIIPIYLHDKSIWIVIDVISAIVFLSSALNDYLIKRNSNFY
jgi:hypothetical protein